MVYLNASLFHRRDVTFSSGSHDRRSAISGYFDTGCRHNSEMCSQFRVIH